MPPDHSTRAGRPRRPLLVALDTPGRRSAGTAAGAKARGGVGDYRLVIVNLPKLTPSSMPVPLPARARDTSPLVRACASDDLTAPAAAVALA